MKKILVTGAGGFIGSHMVKKLKSEGHWVRAIDLKYPEFSETTADEFWISDLTDAMDAAYMFDLQGEIFDEVYAFANWMGGAAVIFTGDNDADILRNSLLVDIHTAHYAYMAGVKKLFYSGSACCYSQSYQTETNAEGLKENYDYPAYPDSDYGFGKLASERVYQAYQRNYGLNIRIGRFHNIFGEESCYNNGKEKYPASVSRKVAMAKDGESIEIWGDGQQTRSFLYISEAMDAVSRLMESSYSKPVNIGSSEQISINDLAKMVIDISGKDLTIKNVESNALGVRGRNSNNDLIKEVLNWSPSASLRSGMGKLYSWVEKQVSNG